MIRKLVGVAMAQARVAASRQALEATERRYDAGVATLFEVTQARTDFVDATSDEVSARYTSAGVKRTRLQDDEVSG